MITKQGDAVFSFFSPEHRRFERLFRAVLSGFRTILRTASWEPSCAVAITRGTISLSSTASLAMGAQRNSSFSLLVMHSLFLFRLLFKRFSLHATNSFRFFSFLSFLDADVRCKPALVFGRKFHSEALLLSPEPANVAHGRHITG